MMQTRTTVSIQFVLDLCVLYQFVNCSLLAFCVAVHFYVVGGGCMLLALLLVYLLMP